MASRNDDIAHLGADLACFSSSASSSERPGEDVSRRREGVVELCPISKRPYPLRTEQRRDVLLGSDIPSVCVHQDQSRWP